MIRFNLLSVFLIVGVSYGNPFDKEALQKSLLEMLSAHRTSPSQDEAVMEPKSITKGSFHSHEPSTIAMYHDGPGGHHHDSDGHTHHDPSSIGKFHDGPGGHAHDNDGHRHHDRHHHRSGQHHEGDGHTHATESEEQIDSLEETKDKENLRDITLTISKLLFHLSQV